MEAHFLLEDLYSRDGAATAILLYITAEMLKVVCKKCPCFPVTLLSKKLLVSYILMKEQRQCAIGVLPF